MASRKVGAVGAWSLAAAFAACTGGYVEDPAGYCRQLPSSAGCSEASGGRGGAAGATGQGGAGAPLMGSGGTAPGGSAGSAGQTGGGSAGSAGGTPGCVAPEVECGDRCADLATDAENCGACGYACGAGAACAAGACAPQTVVSGVVAPYAFALDAESVYFVAPVASAAAGNPLQPVQKVPRAGGAPTAVAFTGDAKFRSRTLAVVAGSLYFGDLGGLGALRQAPVAGGDVTTFASSQGAIQTLVAQSAFLWWSTFTGDTSRVRRAPLAGGPATPEELASSTPQFGQVPALAIEGEGEQAAAYWVNRGGSATDDNGLWRRTFAVGVTAPESLTEGGALLHLGLSADAVFVADAAQGIGRAQKAGGGQTPAPVVAAAGVGGTLQGLAVAGDKLYWLAFNAGQLELHRSGLDGGEARVLGRVAAKLPAYWSQPFGPAALVVDGGFVYFADPGTIAGDTQPSNETLVGVTGAADGA
ncbi:MAG TPA: hypothetical protein VFS00_04705, partial [Polyangiaceae bacterium]|nr:hypothetical protein [Polyangiaceae bacterium]